MLYRSQPQLWNLRLRIISALAGGEIFISLSSSCLDKMPLENYVNWCNSNSNSLSERHSRLRWKEGRWRLPPDDATTHLVSSSSGHVPLTCSDKVHDTEAKVVKVTQKFCSLVFSRSPPRQKLRSWTKFTGKPLTDVRVYICSRLLHHLHWSAHLLHHFYIYTSLDFISIRTPFLSCMQ